MTEKQLYEWAIKGLMSRIDELEKDINTGKRLLLDYERGLKPTTTKTPYEIQEIIKEKRAEIEKLYNEKSDLSWKLDVEMQ